MTVTVRDVAKAAGVSTATVSRALRAFPTVDPATREHVLAVARKLDYVGTPAAATLSTGRTGAVGIVTPYVDRWSFGRMLSGIERELRSGDTDLMVYRVGDPSVPHPAPPHQRLRRRVDGFLVMSLSAQSPDLEQLLKLDMPSVLIGSSSPGTSSVMIDDRAGAYAATRHLIDMGHRRIGLIYGRTTQDPLALEHERYLGFLDALHDAGLAEDETLHVAGYFKTEGGGVAMASLLRHEEPPTAVFAMSDEMAFGALRTMHAQGIEPGRDIAIIGFDGHEMADMFGLSTISQPLEDIGAQAARALLARLRNPLHPPEALVMATTLLPRASTAPARDVPAPAATAPKPRKKAASKKNQPAD